MLIRRSSGKRSRAESLREQTAGNANAARIKGISRYRPQICEEERTCTKSTNPKVIATQRKYFVWDQLPSSYVLELTVRRLASHASRFVAAD